MSTRENEVVAATAVAAQGEPAGVSWGDPSKHRILGKRFPRHEGPDKVSGRAIYTYDVVLPGMLYGRIVRSPYAAARVPWMGINRRMSSLEEIVR